MNAIKESDNSVLDFFLGGLFNPRHSCIRGPTWIVADRIQAIAPLCGIVGAVFHPTQSIGHTEEITAQHDRGNITLEEALKCGVYPLTLMIGGNRRKVLN